MSNQGYWERRYKLGALTSDGHYNAQTGKLVTRAEKGDKQAGKALGRLAKTQQDKLQRQADAGVSLVTLGASDVVKAGVKDVAAIARHPARHRKLSNIGKSETGKLANEWVVRPVKAAAKNPTNPKKVALGGLAAAGVLPIPGLRGVSRLTKLADEEGAVSRGLTTAQKMASKGEHRKLVYHRAVVQHPAQSRSFLTRPLQRIFDRASMAHPDNPLVGSGRRVSKQMARNRAEEMRRSVDPVDVAHAHNLPHMQESPKDIAHYWWAQAPKARRGDITYLHEVRAKKQQLLDDAVKAPSPRGDIQKAAHATRVRDLTVDVSKLDKAIKKAPKLDMKLIRAAEAYSGGRKSTLIEHGVLDPVKAADREALVHRWLTGAEYETRTPGKLGKPSRRLLEARNRVQRINNAYGRALARSKAKNATMRPIAKRSEAMARLEELEAQHEGLIQSAMRERRGAGRHDAGETARRNRERALWNKTNGRKGRNWPTLEQEFRDETVATLDRLAEANKNEDWARGYLQQREEIDHLKAEIDATHPLLGHKTEKEADFGMTKKYPNRSKFDPLVQKLGGAGSVAKDELEQLEAARLRRMKPTGIVDRPHDGPVVHLADSQSRRGGYIKKPATYIRFGELPEGRSMNHLSGRHEAGVSVYHAWRDPRTGKYVVPSGSEQYLLTHFNLQGERSASIHEVSGRELTDVGGDGEPLLEAGSVTKKKKLTLDDFVSESDPNLTLAGRELSAAETPDWHIAEPGPTDPMYRGIYIGHRPAKPPIMQRVLSPGKGKPRLPEGVGKENTMGMLNSGGARMSVHVAREDFLASQTYHHAKAIRDEVGKLGPRALDVMHEIPEKPIEGYVLVNGAGKTLPRSWKTDLLAKAHDDEELIKRSREVLENAIGKDPDSWARIVQEAKEAGTLGSVRIVPKKLFDRYYDHLLQAQKPGKLGKAYDRATDVAVSSIIIGRIGFIPKQLVQNIVMAVPSMGVRIIPALTRGVALSPLNPRRSDTDRELFRLLWSESGGGAGGAVSMEAAGKPLRYLGRKSTEVGDSLFRVSAMLHALSNQGIVSKVALTMSEAKKREVINFVKSAKGKDRMKLNDAMQETRDLLGDFNRLSPQQRATWRRIAMVPNWLVAGTRYPAKFAVNRPITTAGLIYAGLGEPGSPIKLNKRADKYLANNLPPWAEGVPVGGNKVQPITSITPASIPGDVFFKTRRDHSGHGIMKALLPGEYSQAVIEPIWDISHSQITGSHGTYKTGFLESLTHNLERMVPSERFIRDEISPPKDPRTYTSDKSRLGRAIREFGGPAQYENAGGGGGGDNPHFHKLPPRDPKTGRFTTKKDPNLPSWAANNHVPVHTGAGRDPNLPSWAN